MGDIVLKFQNSGEIGEYIHSLDMDKAIDFLRKKGLATAQKRAGRAMTEGTIQSYIHMGGKLGVLVEVNCETDFVAKNDDFVAFAKNLAMHIAASNPLGIQPDDIPEELVNRERDIYRAQALEMGKPEKVIDKIVEGQLLVEAALRTRSGYHRSRFVKRLNRQNWRKHFC